MQGTFNIERRYIITNQVPQLYHEMTFGSIRKLIFDQKNNDMEHILLKCGNTILIDLELFDEYVSRNGIARSILKKKKGSK